MSRARGWGARTGLVLLTLVALLVIGCGKAKPEPGQKTACTCTFLTDYDDAARVDVDVCVGDGKDVVEVAKACAARSAHNHVESCQCKPKTGPCDAAARDACDAH